MAWDRHWERAGPPRYRGHSGRTCCGRVRSWKKSRLHQRFSTPCAEHQSTPLAVKFDTIFYASMFMPRPTGEVADRVARRARGVDAFVRKLEALAVEKRLTRTDIERAYTGAFLTFFTS